MAFLRQNPGFVGLLALGFLGGLGVFLLWRGAVEEAEGAERANERARARLEGVLAGSVVGEGETALRVVPTREHREFLEERVARLRTTLGSLRDRLRVRDPSWLADPADELSFLPKVREFIRRQREAAEEAGTVLAADEAFGFAAFATAAETPPPDRLPVLDRQRQVLGYLLARLLAASPSRIVAVQREAVGIGGEEGPSGRPGASDGDTFVRQAWPGRGKEVPGDTLFFRVVFTGKTSTLRAFLEGLATFALPVVVRSVEVAPAASPLPASLSQEVPRPAPADAGPSWDELFGDPSPESPAGAGARGDSRDPGAPAPFLVDNESRFTVLLLWIEEGRQAARGAHFPEDPS